MHAKMLGFFSGFPERRFPADIAKRLEQELQVRESLVFISAWPSDAARNDEDAAGMHGMFAQCNMPFAAFSVIDERTAPADARRLVRGASCIFLMGGNATLQFRLICEKGILQEIRTSPAVVLGVSAGSSNMAVRALDIWESHVPYAGIGLADITIKAHVSPQDHDLLQTLSAISREHDLPICAMEDNSAIFVTSDGITHIGQIRRVCGDEIRPFAAKP